MNGRTRGYRFPSAALAAFAGGALAAPLAQESTAEPSLLDRQRAVQERIGRLENRMLELSKLLDESEPAKAERLRDGLDQLGRARVRMRVQSVVDLLREGRVGDAEQGQEALLTELNGLLELLTSSLNELDRRREERKRLEDVKRQVRRLLDQQIEQLYQTQHADGLREQAEAEGGAPLADSLVEALRKLERRQRQTQQEGAETRDRLEPGGPDEAPDPGRQALERAVQSMGKSADRLGEDRPDGAIPEQEQAIEALQSAADELEDALRQARQEERQETLQALESRLRSMLTREQEIRETLLATLAEPAATRLRELQLADAAQRQASVTEDCRVAIRILVDEGTTVIVPELLGQVALDMAEVLDDLRGADVSPGTRDTLDEIIEQLSSLLAAVEAKRAEETRAEPQDGQPGQQETAPLLSRSAELRLLRSSQARLNERVVELADAATEPAVTDEIGRLGERQRRLAELTRRMNERQ